MFLTFMPTYKLNQSRWKVNPQRLLPKPTLSGPTIPLPREEFSILPEEESEQEAVVKQFVKTTTHQEKNNI